jgi:CIC family chloride channel protein
LEALLLGVVGALSARVFLYILDVSQSFFLTGIAGYKPPGMPEEGGVFNQVIGPYGLWLIPLATTLGGLISGFLVYSLAPETEGHGTDTVIRAFHNAGGFIRARVVPLKLITSAITIGSGGSAGREGPTALLSAGIASVYATFLRRSDEERRLLVLIGMAAGLSAIFRSPIGAAIFAVEVLYSDMEFEANALLYAMLASVVAYLINGIFVGWEPLFQVPVDLQIPGFSNYVWYVLLGLASGLIATILPNVFYGIRDAFRLLPFSPHIKPAIGGLGVGLMAIVLPEVLGGGYGWIQEAIYGRLTVNLLFLLIFAKMLAFSLTISSGGSGGVFAPSLFVGAMLGGFMAKLFGLPPAGFVVVGMASVFAGAARVPIATLLMVTEMTGGYQLLAPAAFSIMISYFIQMTLSNRLRYKSLYEAQVPIRDDSPAHYVGELQNALRLLGEHRVSVPFTIGHVEIQELVKSGIAIDLSNGKQLAIGAVKPGSPIIGKPIKESVLTKFEDMEMVAILRGKEVLLPHPEVVLQSDDRLMIITSSETWKRLSEYLSSLS